jgi:hypothetical protein
LNPKDDEAGSSDTEGEDGLDDQQQQQQKQPEQEQQQNGDEFDGKRERQPTGNDDFVVVTKCDVESSSVTSKGDGAVGSASGDVNVTQSSLSSSRQAQNDGYTW